MLLPLQIAPMDKGVVVGTGLVTTEPVVIESSLSTSITGCDVGSSAAS